MWRVGVLVYEITPFTRSRVLAVGAVDAIIIPPIRPPPRKRKHRKTGSTSDMMSVWPLIKGRPDGAVLPFSGIPEGC